MAVLDIDVYNSTAGWIAFTQWLSPDGCLMFSVQLHVPLSSHMGQRLSLLQHLVAVAVVGGVHSLDDGYKVSTHYCMNLNNNQFCQPVAPDFILLN